MCSIGVVVGLVDILSEGGVKGWRMFRCSGVQQKKIQYVKFQPHILPIILSATHADSI